MFHNVLVPVDGSPFAEHALPWALAAAGPSGAVHLVHVHEVLAPMAVEGMLVAVPTDDTGLRAAEDDYLGRLAGRLRAAAPGVTVTADNIDPDGPFADALAAAAVETEAELIVTTTRGLGPIGRFLLGSVTDGLVRHAPVPVLVLRPADDGRGPDLAARPRLARVVIPLDGSELAERVVEPAGRLGRALGADFELVMVLDEVKDPVARRRLGLDVPPDGVNPDGPADRADHYLGRVARSLGGAWTQLVESVSPAEAVLGVAGHDPTTGVALATHGRAGLSRLVAGSVADDVVRHAPGPVLVFHPQRC